MLEKLTNRNFHNMLQRFTTSELETLVQKFPYFQQGHLLLAKKYQLENNPKFDEQLQLAALYTQNRELLYELFKKTTAYTSSDGTADGNTLLDSTLSTEVSPATESPKNNEQESLQTIMPVEIAPAENTEQESTHTFDLTVEEVKAEETEVQTEVISHEPETVFEAKTEATQVVDINEPHTFNEWLKVFAYNPTVVDNPYSEMEEAEATSTEQPDELEQLIQQNISVDYLHELVEEETRYSKGLDAFIAAQIQKHRSPSVVKNSDENVLHDDLVTETLAKLYESQRKYSKAIKAYETLALKFPEKNHLFAARIQYIKNLI